MAVLRVGRVHHVGIRIWSKSRNRSYKIIPVFCTHPRCLLSSVKGNGWLLCICPGDGQLNSGTFCPEVLTVPLLCHRSADLIAIWSDGNQCSFLSSWTWETGVHTNPQYLPYFFPRIASTTPGEIYSCMKTKAETFQLFHRCWCLHCHGDLTANHLYWHAHSSVYRRICTGV